MAHAIIGGMRATALGLRVDAARPIIGLASAEDDGASRHLVIREADFDELRSAWNTASPRQIVCNRGANGGLVALVEEDSEIGYRFVVPGAGTYLLSSGGHLATIAPEPGAEPWMIDRVLTSDVLPLAALLQGIESLHAAAVVVDGRVLAISGRSGAGKSTLSLELSIRGHRLFSDDVVAIEPGSGVWCHPGPSVANVRDPGLRERARAGDAPFGRVIADTTEGTRVLVDVCSDRTPLGVLYLIDRSRPVPRMKVSRVEDPRPVLSATFNRLVATPQRLRSHLLTCAQLFTHAEVFNVEVPMQIPPGELGEMLAAHMLGKHGDI